MNAACTAIDFSHVTSLSTALFTNCAKQLQPKLDTTAKMAKFAKKFDEADQGPAVLKLFSAIAMLPPIATPPPQQASPAGLPGQARYNRRVV